MERIAGTIELHRELGEWVARFITQAGEVLPVYGRSASTSTGAAGDLVESLLYSYQSVTVEGVSYK